MRRFEFVQGSSAKFWMADVSGATFIVVYGRLGTDGQRKEKAFPSEDAARRELEKKIAEKLKEGYHEVAAAAAAAAPKGAKGAAAAAPRLQLPPRYVASRGPVMQESVQAAAAALTVLHKSLSGKQRSWVVGLLVRRAHRALEAVAGVDPAAHKVLAGPFAEVMAKVAAPVPGRLPLRLALQLLSELDTAAFSVALEIWRKGPRPPEAVAVIARQVDVLEDPDLALRLMSLLCADRDSGPEVGWTRRWRALQPFVESQLIAKGSTLKAYLQKFDAGGVADIGDRLQRLR